MSEQDTVVWVSQKSLYSTQDLVKAQAAEITTLRQQLADMTAAKEEAERARAAQLLRVEEFIQDFDIWCEAAQGTVEESHALDDLLESRQALEDME